MACEYLGPGGQSDPILTRTLQYAEDTAKEERSKEQLLLMLEEEGLTMNVGENQPVLVNEAIEESLQTVKNINEGAKKFFGSRSDLITLRKAGDIYHVEISEGVLKGMQLKNDEELNETTESEVSGGIPVEETEDVDELSEDEIELDERTQFMKDTTDQLILNLEKQINRLERMPEDDPVAKRQRLSSLKVLKRQLSRIELEKADLDDYMDFVRFVVSLGNKATRLVNKINDEYSENYETTSQKERAKMLQDLTELKKTIDAFYQNDSAKSLLSNLEVLIDGLDDNIEDIEDTLLMLRDAAQEMKDVNAQFLDTGLEIQVDYLLSFAPPEINQQLDRKIAGIRSERRIDGLNRFDKRYPKARREGLDAVLELNIKQLEEKKIGRDSILKELRQTHRDQSKISAFFSPVVYSNDTTIKLFAESVRKSLVDARKETIDFKYDIMQEAYSKYVESQGVGETNVARLYDPITEEVVISVMDSNGERQDIRTVAFVQMYDMNKFNLAKADAFQALREKYNFPTDPTQYEEYFKSDLGKAYLGDTAKWYAENTEPVDGAMDTINSLRRQRNDVFAQIQQLQKQGGYSDQLQALYLQYNDIKYQLLKVYRGGRPIGKLSKPVLSKYRNAKYAAMTPSQREFYDVVVNQYREDQKKIGRNGLPKNSWDDFSYVLPGIRKDARDQFIEDGMAETVRNLKEDRLKKDETDTEFGELLDANGEKVRLIPQYFTGTVNSVKISRDVTNSIIKFHDMSNRYRAKSEIIGVVNMMETAIGAREQLTMTPTGNYLMDRTAQRLGIDQKSSTSGAESNTMQQLRSFVDNVVYGISEQELNNRMNDMNGLSANKLSQLAITMTAFSTLSLNWLQATNQLVLDTMSGTQEAVGGDYYGVGDLAWARSKMYLVGGGIGLMNDKFLPNFAKKNKVAKFLEYFDAFQEFGNEFGTEAGSRSKKALSRDAGFVFQQTAEMMTVGERALALAHSYKGKLLDKDGNVITTESGEPAHLYDVLRESKTGKLEIDPRVANFDESAFVAKLHGMMKRTNQLKGKFDRVHAQRHAVWKLTTLFRNYLVPGLRKRFGSFDGAMVDVEMASVNEGYYATAVNELANAWYDIKEGKIGSAVGRLSPGIFSSKKNKEAKANMRRLYYELLAAQVAGLMAAALSDMMDDDDDDSYVGHFVTYQLLRLRSEWSQFRSPEIFTTVQDPTAAANPVIHFFEALMATKDYLGYQAGLVPQDEVYYQRRAGAFEKGDLKVVKEILDFAPFLRGMFTSSDPEEAARYYDMKK